MSLGPGKTIAVCLVSKKEEMIAQQSGKQACQADMEGIKMNIIHEPMMEHCRQGMYVRV